MTKYKVDIIRISECVVNTLEEAFDNYEDAVEAGQEWLSTYSITSTILERADDSHGIKCEVRRVNKPSTDKIIPFRMSNSK